MDRMADSVKSHNTTLVHRTLLLPYTTKHDQSYLPRSPDQRNYQAHSINEPLVVSHLFSPSFQQHTIGLIIKHQISNSVPFKKRQCTTCQHCFDLTSSLKHLFAIINSVNKIVLNICCTVNNKPILQHIIIITCTTFSLQETRQGHYQHSTVESFYQSLSI